TSRRVVYYDRKRRNIRLRRKFDQGRVRSASLALRGNARSRSYNAAAVVRPKLPVFILRLLAVIGLVALAGCSDKAPDASSPTKSVHSAVPDAPAGHGLFSEVAKQVGIDFRHVNGMSGEFYYPEVIGAGVALFDFDNDGKLDVLILQGGPLVPNAAVDMKTCTARLYR